jgi:7-cyano-7-deazaguanine synthase
MNSSEKKAVTLLSGGLDSTCLAYLLDRFSYTQTFVSFEYGQKHRRELEYAARTAQALHSDFIVVPLSEAMKDIWQNSSLVGPAPVPEGHYAAPTMASTVVPNRNMLFLTVAAAVAVQVGAKKVFLAVHSGDHPIYPDCRPEFLSAINQTMRLSCGVSVAAPFQMYTKAEVVKIGVANGAIFENTWSCYKGGQKHCGLCGTCVERKEAFEIAGYTDPTEYLA